MTSAKIKSERLQGRFSGLAIQHCEVRPRAVRRPSKVCFCHDLALSLESRNGDILHF